MLTNQTLSPSRETQGAAEETRERPTITPPVDVYENDAELLLIADLPGVARDAIELNLEDGALTLSARRTRLIEGAVLGDEIGDGDYLRSFRLPRGLDLESVKAELDSGTLKIRLPKAKEFRPRQIAITAA
ncbi:MAG: Hsp20/alpha crystallin family protein [Myxococcota bacterium]